MTTDMTFIEKLTLATQIDHSYAAMDRQGRVSFETYQHVKDDEFANGEWCWEASSLCTSQKFIAKTVDAALTGLLAGMATKVKESLERAERESASAVRQVEWAMQRVAKIERVL